MTTTLTTIDWAALLLTPQTRWYLDRGQWDHRDPWEPGQCVWQESCPNQVIAYIEYQVAASPSDPHETGFYADELVCANHLADLIAYALDSPGGNPLVAETVVEVGVDPAYLRLMGVDPAVVARFNDGAMGCGL